VDPASLAAASRELISFQVGDQEFCVDIGAVLEIRGWTPATPVPSSADYVSGVINLRGVVMAVMDVSARLGMGSAEPTARHVIIVVDIRGQKIGLLVDAVCETLTIRSDQIQPAPNLGGEDGRGFIVGYLAAADRMITVVDLEPLLPARAPQAA